MCRKCRKEGEEEKKTGKTCYDEGETTSKNESQLQMTLHTNTNQMIYGTRLHILRAIQKFKSKGILCLMNV